MRGLPSCFFVSDLRGSRMIQLFHGVCRSDLYGVASHPYPKPHHTYIPVRSSSLQTSSGCIHLGSFNMVAQHRGGQGSGRLIQVQDPAAFFCDMIPYTNDIIIVSVCFTT